MTTCHFWRHCGALRAICSGHLKACSRANLQRSVKMCLQQINTSKRRENPEAGTCPGLACLAPAVRSPTRAGLAWRVWAAPAPRGADSVAQQARQRVVSRRLQLRSDRFRWSLVIWSCVWSRNSIIFSAAATSVRDFNNALQNTETNSGTSSIDELQSFLKCQPRGEGYH